MQISLGSCHLELMTCFQICYQLLQATQIHLGKPENYQFKQMDIFLRGDLVSHLVKGTASMIIHSQISNRICISIHPPNLNWTALFQYFIEKIEQFLCSLIQLNWEIKMTISCQDTNKHTTCKNRLNLQCQWMMNGYAYVCCRWSYFLYIHKQTWEYFMGYLIWFNFKLKVLC